MLEAELGYMESVRCPDCGESTFRSVFCSVSHFFGSVSHPTFFCSVPDGYGHRCQGFQMGPVPQALQAQGVKPTVFPGCPNRRILQARMGTSRISAHARNQVFSGHGSGNSTTLDERESLLGHMGSQQQHGSGTHRATGTHSPQLALYEALAWLSSELGRVPGYGGSIVVAPVMYQADLSILDDLEAEQREEVKGSLKDKTVYSAIILPATKWGGLNANVAEYDPRNFGGEGKCHRSEGAKNVAVKREAGTCFSALDLQGGQKNAKVQPTPGSLFSAALCSQSETGSTIDAVVRDSGCKKQFKSGLCK